MGKENNTVVTTVNFVYAKKNNYSMQNEKVIKKTTSTNKTKACALNKRNMQINSSTTSRYRRHRRCHRRHRRPGRIFYFYFSVLPR